MKRAWAIHPHVIDKCRTLVQNSATQIKLKIKPLDSVRYSAPALTTAATPLHSTIKPINKSVFLGSAYALPAVAYTTIAPSVNDSFQTGASAKFIDRY